MGASSSSTLSRRDVIKRGVIAGGAVWAAPSILKLSPAYGTHDSSPSCACSTGTLSRVQFEVPLTGNTLIDNCQSGPGIKSECTDPCWDATTDCTAAGVESTSYNTSTQRVDVILGSTATLVHARSSCPQTGDAGTGPCADLAPQSLGGGRTRLRAEGCEPGEVISITYCL